MKKIGWLRSPGWAYYAAQDADGEWYWHEYEPWAGDCEWQSSGRKEKFKPLNHSWRETLVEEFDEKLV